VGLCEGLRGPEANLGAMPEARPLEAAANLECDLECGKVVGAEKAAGRLLLMIPEPSSVVGPLVGQAISPIAARGVSAAEISVVNLSFVQTYPAGSLREVLVVAEVLRHR